MKRNKVLVDLSALKDIYCGLGQVAMSYGKYFQENYKIADSEYDLTLLLPDEMIGKFGNEVKYLSSTRKITRRYQFLLPKFDVWHSIHQLSRFRPRNSQTKLILTVHDLNYLYERVGFSRYRKNKQIQRKLNRADEIVCISDFAKSELEKHMQLKAKKCKRIYNHVEILDKSLATKTNADVKKPFFFSIGVIQKKKNFHVLLDMMKLMPDMQLYIAGKEIEKDEKNGYAKMIRERIEKENINNVSLLGPISHREKIWLFDNCEAFMFPSLFEGFGLPVIEAMQFGKPVFSSTETSLKEIGSEYAYFWEDFSAEKMHKIVVEALAKHSDEIIAKEIEYALSFSTNKHFKEYEELYAKL